MVAALSCNAIPLYNQFVTAYQKDLFASDKALQAYFRRLNAKTGTADYHAFKTRLANNSSRTSIAHMGTYCEKAQAMFQEALAPANRPTLTTFISSQPYIVDISSCDPTFRMAGSVQADAAPAPAQGGQ